MKATINNTTGLMIESQSDAANNAVLIANAQAFGYTDVSVLLVSDAEHTALIAARDAAQLAENPQAARSALIHKIDADTDAIYRAVQGDRAMEYLHAEAEAKAYKKDGYTGAVPDSVASWASAKGESAIWATDDILTTARGWRQAQSSIRTTRLTCKEQARTATDLAPIVATWSGFLVTVKSALGL